MFTEFFCGIGGLSACLPKYPSALSIDINRNALAVHEMNFAHRRLCKTIESLTADELADAPRDFWWMSPPCQPYTRRGKQRDLEDARSAGFQNMLTLIERLQPLNIGMENVPEFQDSQSHLRLLSTLERGGYRWAEKVICPTELGARSDMLARNVAARNVAARNVAARNVAARNRRRRYYLIASQGPLKSWLPLSDSDAPSSHRPLLQTDIDFAVYSIDDSWLDKYESALHIVSEAAFESGAESTTCFTSAYGRSPVHSGSWLQTEQGIRRFTPQEILWQLGFPQSFQLPDWPAEKLWPLTGNTLSLPAIKYLLRHLPIESATSPVQCSLRQ